MQRFNAYTVYEEESTILGKLAEQTVADLSAGDVQIKAAYSSVNYKDALASQKNGGVIRSYPMIPGIDVSGTVIASKDPRFVEGQKVLVTGYGLGVSHTGGFSQLVQVPGDWVVPLPAGLSLKEAMILGTAGFTAALSIIALEKQGLTAQLEAPILITGASGGVGSLALLMLKNLGCSSITALTRKQEAFTTLEKLGASRCITLDSFIPEKPAPLAKQAFAFAIDTTGGTISSTLLPQLRYGGSSAICGNAAGIQLNTTVLPFILRGIHLIGIDSVNVPMTTRLAVWQRLATDLKVTDSAIYEEITLTDLPTVFTSLKAGQHIGRTIVRLS